MELPLYTLNTDSHLTIVARGLNIPLIIAHQLYRRTSSSRCLWVLLNLKYAHVCFINDRLMELTSTAPMKTLETHYTPITMVNAQLTAQQRCQVYAQGGFVSVTNRIVLIDMLNKNLPCEIVHGIMIHQAHRVHEMTQEAFAIRLYKQGNAHGIVQAYSENAHAIGAAFKLEKLMRTLHVRKLELWPRFHYKLIKEMEKKAPNVDECRIQMTTSMQSIQDALVEIIDTCVTVLKRDNKTYLGSLDLTTEHALTQNFDTLIREELLPVWHKVSAKSKQLLEDLKAMRDCLTFLVNYDAVSFYKYLMIIRQRCSQTNHSVWLYTDAAERLVRCAKERLYKFHSGGKSDIDSLGHGAPRKVVPMKYKQKKEEHAVPAMTDADVSSYDTPQLRVKLEENPKWQLLTEILDSIYKKLPVLDQQSGRIMIVCRDEASCNFLQRYFHLGGPALLEKQWQRWLFGLRLHQRPLSLPADPAARTPAQTEVQLLRDLFVKHLHNLKADLRRRRSEQQRKLEEQITDPDITSSRRRSLMSKRKLNDAHGKVDMHGATANVTISGGSASKKQRKTQYKEPAHTRDDDEVVSLDANIVDVHRSDDEFDLDGYGAVKTIDEPYSVAHSQFDMAALPSKILVESNVNLDAEIGSHVFILSTPQILLQPIESLSTALFNFRPAFIIMCEPDLSVVREIEVYQLQVPSMTVNVFYTVYDDSVEDQRFRTSLALETQAFQSLIQQKGHMVLPEVEKGMLNSDSKLLPKLSSVMLGKDFEDFSTGTYDAYAALLPHKTQNSRVGGGAALIKQRILIDMREFRSSLPSLLHAREFEVLPVTLEVADYLLSPTIAVERKSVPDLFGSFSSGRLFKQMEQIGRYYKYPLLLIEFDRRRPFVLIMRSEIDSEISIRSIISKIVILCLHFPNMRIAWTRDSYSTTDLFLALKQSQPQPEIENAVAVGVSVEDDTGIGSTLGDIAGESFITDDQVFDKDVTASLTPSDMLHRLPGLNVNNVRDLLSNVSTIAELSACTQDQLSQWIGSSCARKLFAFMHTDLAVQFE